jgi:hypothetical protein
MLAVMKKTATKASPPVSDEGRGEAFQQLKAILAKYAKKLELKHDTPDNYYLDSKKPWKGKPLFFAATSARKSYVSFYFFPIYMFPDLADELSADLKKRQQGKSCFNFQAPDKALFKELTELTKRGFDRFAQEDLL